MMKMPQHWTSSEAQRGFRHFRVVGQGGRGQKRWVELASVLDPTQRLRLSLQDLHDPLQWRSGLRPVVEDALSESNSETQGAQQQPLPE